MGADVPQEIQLILELQDVAFVFALLPAATIPSKSSAVSRLPTQPVKYFAMGEYSK